mgnify:CR=1 FL=1
MKPAMPAAIAILGMLATATWGEGVSPRPATSPRQWESIPLTHINAADFVGLFFFKGVRMGVEGPRSQSGPPELPEGIEAIGAYHPLNAVLVRGEAAAVEELKALLKAVDTEERPVLVRLRLRALLKEAAARLPMGPLGEELVAARGR